MIDGGGQDTQQAHTKFPHFQVTITFSTNASDIIINVSYQ